MSKQHGARQQKQLAKQKAKRESRRRQLALRTSPNPAIRLKAADDWPITACLVPENLWSIGIGNLLIARRTAEGQLACAVFLVDVFYLGVKDAMWKIVTPAEFNLLRREFDAHGRLEEVAPEYFAKLVYRAADYGQSLGSPPHRDFRHAQRLLSGIDPAQCPTEFEFGQDGRPMYIRGPSESITEAKIIAARVHAQGGDYLVPLKESEVPLETIAGIETDDECQDEDALSDHEDEPTGEESKPQRWSWLPWR